MKHNKQVCVIGLGMFGSHLARTLAATKCDVLALDSNPEKIEAIKNDVQQALVVDARKFETLQAVVPAGIPEVVVSLGPNFEAATLCMVHLKKIGVGKIRAKAVSDEQATILRALGAEEVIFPERATAERLATNIVNPNLLEYLELQAGYEVTEIAAPRGYRGKSLAEIGLRKRFNIFVMGVDKADEKKFVFMPGPDYVIGKDDLLVVVGKHEDIFKMTGGR